MFSLDLHVIWREGNAGGILRGVEIVFLIFLLWLSWDLGLKTSASVRASLITSLIDFESLMSLKRVILAGILAN